MIYRNNISESEKNFILAIKDKPKSMKELEQAGVLPSTHRICTLLISLERRGFLIYEEPLKKGSLLCRYGLLGAEQGSLAEQFLKGVS